MAIPFLSNVDFNLNEAKNLKLHLNDGAITSPTPQDGQVYFDTGDNRVKVYHTNAFHSIAGDITGISITAGDGLTGTVSTTLGDHTQIINVVGGDGITANADEIEVAVDGVTIELSATDGTGAVQAKTAAVADGGTALATGDQIYDFVTGLGYVESVTSGNTNTITIGGTAADPTIAANTAAVTNGSANLATGDQIYDFVIGQLGGYLPLTAGSGKPLSGDLYITHNNAKIVLGNNDAANTANIIEGIGESGKTYIQFGNNENDGGDDYLRFKVAYNGGSTNDYIFMSAVVEEEDLPNDGIKSGNITIGSSITNFVMDQIYLNANQVITSNNLTVTGDLVVNGTTTTVNSTTVTIDDPVFTLGGDTAPASDDNKDRGIEFRYHDGTSAKLGFFGYDDSAEKFTFLTDATNTSEVFTGTKATIIANLEGNVTGNATNITTSASTSVAGKVELATSAETITGTDTSRAVTPDSLAARTVVATIDVSNSTLTGQTAPYKATIEHALGTKDLIVQLQDVTTFEVIHADISTTAFNGSESTNKITIGFDNALPSNDVRVIITSGAGATSITPTYA